MGQKFSLNVPVQTRHVVVVAMLAAALCSSFAFAQGPQRGADGLKTRQGGLGVDSIEEKTQVHRLSNSRRTTFDAFVYVNRIPEQAVEGESTADLAGRILGRLANQEGRVLLKLPAGMNRKSYEGFKTFLSYTGTAKAGNCVACHAPADFTDLGRHVVEPGEEAKATPSLRNVARRGADLRQILRQKIRISQLKQRGMAPSVAAAYQAMRIRGEDIEELVAFLELLDDVSDEQFRERVLNTSLYNPFHDQD